MIPLVSVTIVASIVFSRYSSSIMKQYINMFIVYLKIHCSVMTRGLYSPSAPRLRAHRH